MACTNSFEQLSVQPKPIATVAALPPANVPFDPVTNTAPFRRPSAAFQYRHEWRDELGPRADTRDRVTMRFNGSVARHRCFPEQASGAREHLLQGLLGLPERRHVGDHSGQPPLPRRLRLDADLLARLCRNSSTTIRS